ncbi:MAG TPA: glycosyltransferase N-terminal domain-containing protein [Methylocella sp.]|nr:glycosyltransferase N-terminal domain-containing protein [Methylocella sp.]
MKASALLAAYRLATAGFGLTGPLYLYWRGKLGREDFSRRRERLGRPILERPGGPLALLHAASSEQAAILPPLVEKLGQLGFNVVLTTSNGAAGPFHAPRLPPCLHQLAPLDVPQFTARFLEHWRPDIVLISGAEIPPNLIVETSRRQIPLVFVNARLSARSFLIWRNFPAPVGALLERIDMCLAQTNIDAGWFAKLGMREVQVTGNLKYDFAPPPVDQSALARLLARIGTRPVWVADGTYPGEEEIALAAHRRLTAQFPDLLTVIVPHNPKRGFEIAQSAVKMKLTVGLRGGDRETAPLPEIYIAHTRGEAGLFYRGADVIFAGKSLCRGGGKNPVEAASLGCAILHGPEVDDFEEIYKALDQAGGGGLVFDAETLAKHLALLFFDKAELRAMARTAAETAEQLGGASTRIVVALKPYLAQAIVASRAGDA